MADQLVPNALPFHGNDVTRAPAMAALAEDGVVFENAYTASPLCSPARASLMTGLLPSRTHTYDNAAEFSSEIPTFAHYLRSAGYRTVLAGKMHFCGADQLHGFEERLTTDIYPADYGWTPDWSQPDHRPHWYHDMSSVTEAGPCIRTNQLDFDDEVAATAERALFGHIRSRDERPFCFVVSFTHPHDPYATQHEHWGLYRDEDIPMPVHDYDESTATPHEKRMRHVCAMDDAEITDEQVRAARRAYLGNLSYVDDKIGRLVKILRETGTLDNTIIVLTSDHGDMQGERGLWYKMSFYEGSARVPLMVSAPAFYEPGRVSTPVSSMDLLPTLVAMVNGGDTSGIVGELDGQNLVPLLTGESDERTAVTAEYLAEGAIAPIVMLRRGDHKFVHCPIDPDELYDVSADPLERTNLVDDPEYAEVVAEFRKEVAERWDLDAIDREVHESQQRRFAVVGAHTRGIDPAWDYAPPYDAKHAYIRNHMDLGDLEAMARYPAVNAPASPSPR